MAKLKDSANVASAMKRSPSSFWYSKSAVSSCFKSSRRFEQRQPNASTAGGEAGCKCTKQLRQLKKTGGNIRVQHQSSLPSIRCAPVAAGSSSTVRPHRASEVIVGSASARGNSAPQCFSLRRDKTRVRTTSRRGYMRACNSSIST